MTTVDYKVGDDVSYGKYTKKQSYDGRTIYTETGCRYVYLVAGVHNHLDPHF